ncbi:hypothetical protein V8C35DRAFT_287753 [Trichoderma chlorosporum]
MPCHAMLCYAMLCSVMPCVPLCLYLCTCILCPTWHLKLSCLHRLYLSTLAGSWYVPPTAATLGFYKYDGMTVWIPRFG